MSHPSSSHRSNTSYSASRRCVSGLSDRGLLGATAKLAKTERLTTLKLLMHFNEVEKRELYLSLGCGSMYDYCVNHLGYSRSAAWRRIHSARCIVRFPEVYALLENGALNLTTLSIVATALNRENKTELLRRVRGKSQDEVENMLASYRPPAAFRDRVKPVRVTVPVTATPTASDNLGLHSGGFSITTDSSGGSAAHTGTPAASGFRAAANPTAVGSEVAPRQSASSGGGHSATPRETEPLSEHNSAGSSTRYRIEKQLLIQFLASQGFMAKYQDVRSLLSNKLAQLSFEKVFETLLDDYLERHSPAKKQERREKRAAAKQQRTKPKPTEPNETRETGRPNRDGIPSASTDKLSRKKFDEHSRSGSKTILLTNSGDERNSSQDTPSENSTQPPPCNKSAEKSRHIPAKTRDAVYVRDKSRCTHVGANGKRCTSTYRLQVDHIIPFARGGTNALSNLRLLCAKHNKLEAKRVYGAAKIDSYCKRE